jgi:hypothetical protein
MWRKSKSRKNNSYKRFTKKEKEAIWTIAFIFIIFVLLWVIFWLWVILAIFLILKTTHKINIFLNLYDTKYYYWVIITFLISFWIILFWWTQIAYNMGKINNTFWWWAVESSDYWKFWKSKWKTTIESNVEWIIQKSVIESISKTWTTN